MDIDVVEQLLNYQHPKYDWKHKLESTEQNPRYHGEGNVLIHTRMVLTELVKDSDYQKLTIKCQKLLIIAAFLHDIAKSFCTKVENGTIISPGHAVKGGLESRKLFYRYDFLEEIFGKLAFEERETVSALIRYHGLPIYFLEKEDITKELFKASLEVNLKHLSILSRADIRGRICQDSVKLLEQIELFEETCKEFDCWEIARCFNSPKGKLMYMKYGEQYLHYTPYESAGAKVIMMAGLPASGKDTYIKNHFSGIPVISLDDIREELKISPAGNQGKVIQTAKNRAKIYLAGKTDFVWNATNLFLSNRTSLIDLFLGYGASIRIIYLESPYHVICERNEMRNRTVPNNILGRMINHLDVPKAWEAEQVEYCISE